MSAAAATYLRDNACSWDTPFDELPDELMVMVLANLEAVDICRLAVVCT